jgi:hypothetical protein
VRGRAVGLWNRAWRPAHPRKPSKRLVRLYRRVEMGTSLTIWTGTGRPAVFPQFVLLPKSRFAGRAHDVARLTASSHVPGRPWLYVLVVRFLRSKAT